MSEQNPAEPERPLPIHDPAEEDVPDDDIVVPDRDARQIVHPIVEHVHGPEEVAYEADELIVLCLVRDGRPYVRSFVEHYSSMGVKHLVFLDNGSTDGTVEVLTEYDNVTVLRTELPYREHHGLMVRYLVERFGQGRWSLCVDIDELFDYPYSDVVGLDSLLRYLNSNSYTAVVAQMLDMFPEKPLSGRAGNLDEPLKELHRFYDISDLRRRNIREHPRCPPDNTYGGDDIAAFSGGVRLSAFGVNTFLTKHPLVFLDGEVKPVKPGPHWHSSARVADFTGVLLHYKFLDEYLHKQAEKAVREEHRKVKGTVWYKTILEALDRPAGLSITTDASRELKSVNDLVGTQFMSVSRQYMRFVESEEQRNGDHSEGRWSERLFEALFDAKAEVTWLAEQVENMREQNRTLRRVPNQAEMRKLRRQLEQMRRELEQVRREVEKVQLLRRGELEDIRRLNRELADIKSSRGWKIANGINVALIKTRSIFKGGRS
jgi:hypothetical protein